MIPRRPQGAAAPESCGRSLRRTACRTPACRAPAHTGSCCEETRVTGVPSGGRDRRQRGERRKDAAGVVPLWGAADLPTEEGDARAFSHHRLKGCCSLSTAERSTRAHLAPSAGLGCCRGRSAARRRRRGAWRGPSPRTRPRHTVRRSRARAASRAAPPLPCRNSEAAAAAPRRRPRPRRASAGGAPCRRTSRHPRRSDAPTTRGRKDLVAGLTRQAGGGRAAPWASLRGTRQTQRNGAAPPRCSRARRELARPRRPSPADFSFSEENHTWTKRNNKGRHDRLRP